MSPKSLLPWREGIALSVWLLAATAMIAVGDFMINAASLIAFLLAAGQLYNLTQIYELVRARRSRGESIWYGFGGVLAYLCVPVATLVATWIWVYVKYPTYLSPFQSFEMQLPSLQGYATAIAAHFAALIALKWIPDQDSE